MLVVGLVKGIGRYWKSGRTEKFIVTFGIYGQNMFPPL